MAVMICLLVDGMFVSTCLLITSTGGWCGCVEMSTYYYWLMVWLC